MQGQMRIFDMIEEIHKDTNKLLYVKISLEDFINLIFFCDFDLETWALK